MQYRMLKFFNVCLFIGVIIAGCRSDKNPVSGTAASESNWLEEMTISGCRRDTGKTDIL